MDSFFGKIESSCFLDLPQLQPSVLQVHKKPENVRTSIIPGMDSFIETIASSCFPELLQPAVLLELKKPGNYRNQVQSLSRLCIRDIVRPRIKLESVGFVRFKLLFQEKLDILETSQLIRDDAIFKDDFGFDLLLNGFNRLMSWQRKLHLNSDPDIMRQVLEQNLEGKRYWNVKLSILEHSFCMVLNDGVIVEVGHENYDTEWALVFTRIAFKKNIYLIQFEVGINQNEDHVRELLSAFINQIGLVAPEDENWELARQHKGNSIYFNNKRFSKRIMSRQSFLTKWFSLSPSIGECDPDRGRIFYMG